LPGLLQHIHYAHFCTSYKWNHTVSTFKNGSFSQHWVVSIIHVVCVLSLFILAAIWYCTLNMPQFIFSNTDGLGAHNWLL
jgi:hypothetical protein